MDPRLAVTVPTPTVIPDYGLCGLGGGGGGGGDDFNQDDNWFDSVDWMADNPDGATMDDVDGANRQADQAQADQAVDSKI